MKAVFFCLSRSLAHAGRVVRLAKALKARGHTVILAGAPGFFVDPHLVTPGELPVETVWEPELAGLLQAARGQAPQHPEHVIAERMLKDELALLERVKPDLVVTDNRRTPIVSAEIKNIPSLSLANASMLGPCCAMAPRLENLAAICAPILGAKREQVLAAPQYARLKPTDPVPLDPQPLGTEVSAVFERHGGRRRRWVHELCFGDRTLILDPPALMPTRDLPAGAKQVGPFFPELQVAAPDWWSEIDPAQPLVHVTWGSTGGDGFDRVVKQLAAARMQITVTTAHVKKAPGMSRVFASRYVPAEILARAQLVVCHGGTQTVYQSLASGTPVVSMPGHLETAVTAIALVQAQLGVSLSPSAIAQNTGLLRRTVESMIADEELRARVAKAASGINDGAALNAAVEAAESLAGSVRR